MVTVAFVIICDSCGKYTTDGQTAHDILCDFFADMPDGWNHDRKGDLLCPDCLKKLTPKEKKKNDY